LEPQESVSILDPVAGTPATGNFPEDSNGEEKTTMSKKHKGGSAPIPKGNQSHSGPQEPGGKPVATTPKGAPASEHDPKRRLGNYDAAGEHAIEQPDGKQGPNH
jgi:hypothetical protein